MGRSESNNKTPLLVTQRGSTIDFFHLEASGFYYISSQLLWFASQTARNDEERNGFFIGSWEQARAYIKLTRGV
jgi:hypothetical protein